MPNVDSTGLKFKIVTFNEQKGLIIWQKNTGFEELIGFQVMVESKFGLSQRVNSSGNIRTQMKQNSFLTNVENKMRVENSDSANPTESGDTEVNLLEAENDSLSQVQGLGLE